MTLARATNHSPGQAAVSVRPGRPSDAAAAGAICYQAFKTIAEQHGFPPDLESVESAQGLLSMVLTGKRAHGFVAEAGGRVVGSNFLWGPGPIAGVGPITVDPDHQNGAVGRALMEAVLGKAASAGFAGVRLLQAAYHNRSLSLYTKLGFEVREPLSQMQGKPLGIALPGRRARAATLADIEACDRLHWAIHGFLRTADLKDAIAEGSAMVVEQQGRLTGYTTGIGFFGHAVGLANDDLKALIAAAPAFTGPGFHVPSRNGELFRWCLAQGLRVVQPMTLMSRGLYNEPKGAFLPSILF